MGLTIKEIENAKPTEICCVAGGGIHQRQERYPIWHECAEAERRRAELLGMVPIGMPGIEKRVARYPQFFSETGSVHEFGAIGCFGSEISPPNLDRLASRGMRVNQFYNNPRGCSSPRFDRGGSLVAAGRLQRPLAGNESFLCGQ